jgi:hypothetical protein
MIGIEEPEEKGPWGLIFSTVAAGGIIALVAFWNHPSLADIRKTVESKVHHKPITIEWVLTRVGTNCKEEKDSWRCQERNIQVGLKSDGSVIWK